MKAAVFLFAMGSAIIVLALLASVVNRRLPPAPSCTLQVEALHAERIAREGKTDREFYAANPNHFR